MKAIILLAIILTTFSSTYAQSDYFSEYKESTCKRSADFEKDKRTGQLKVYSSSPKRSSDTYERLLLKRYNIEFIAKASYGLPEKLKCYNSFSMPYIQTKYGDSVFYKTRYDAAIMDNSGLGDSRAIMKEGQDSLIRNHFYETVHPDVYESYLQSEFKGMRLYCSLFVDSSGKIYSSFHHIPKDGQRIDDAIKAASKLVPYKVIPALDNGQPAEGRVSVVVSFTAETKRQYFESPRRKEQ